MKKVFFIFNVVLMTAFGFVSCSNDDNNDSTTTNISADALPVESQSFLKLHFEGSTVVNAQQKTIPNTPNHKYEVLLDNNVKIEFDANGNWTEIESLTNQALPETLIPVKIKEYVTTNYQGYIITEIDKKVYGYKIEIFKGHELDLMFDANENFLGIDK